MAPAHEYQIPDKISIKNEWKSWSTKGGSKETIIQIDLNAKMLGADAYRLVKAGLSGMPLPLKLFTFPLVYWGERHTHRPMAS